MRFRAAFELSGKTATGIEVPAEVVTALGQGRRPPVTATINGFTYRTSVAAPSSRFLRPVSSPVARTARQAPIFPANLCRAA